MSLNSFRMPLSSLLFSALLLMPAASLPAKDYFLTLGGGYSPSGNQVSLEKNVLYFQRVLATKSIEPGDTYFADGSDKGRDLEVMDRESVPKANRLMAEFFGSTGNLGLSYRNHEVPNVRGATNPANVRKWFAETGAKLEDGDRLLIYVTAHGNGSRDRDNEYDTTIAMWKNSSLKVSEFVKLLDGLPAGVDVVTVMVQCHAGGFARMIFEDADPDKGVSKRSRAGFFATVHDRPAAGCTSEVNEASYVEYSTYFWAALSGMDRAGNAIEPPDYNKDGTVSFDEAHAYTVLTANTIDLPIKTSGEFLSIHSRFGNNDPDLLANDVPYEQVLKLASPSEKVVLEGLSDQLELSGPDRIVKAWRATQERQPSQRFGRGGGGGRSRGRRPTSPAGQLRQKIVTDIKKRWPELANVLNPVSVELLTSRSEEFVAAIEGHRDYKRYRELSEEAREDPTKKKVKYERFLRFADNVILAENLRRGGNEELLQQYQAILAAETGTLQSK